MQVKWLNAQASFDQLILVADIGGTNSNLGLVGYQAGKFTLILETVFASNAIDGLIEPLQLTLAAAQKERADLTPSHCCISAAGPVANNACIMTNLPWSIDGDQISAAINLPTLVINDFLAISYGIPTLDVNDPQQIHQLAHAEGSRPLAQLATKAVVGPGTGLGCAYLVPHQGKYIPASSEGGHISFAPFDADSQSFRDYMREVIGATPGVEPLVSGTGIANMFAWWQATRGLPAGDAWAQIAAADPSDRPRLISMLSKTDATAAQMMELFVKLLASFASDVAAFTLPLGGLYLAGGVAQKELHWLEKDHLFTRTFVENYNPNLVRVLKQVPIYLIKDYSISLYGAANASINLQ